MKYHRIKFIIGSFLTTFLLPIIIYQGKRITKKTPKLPEAKEPEGMVDIGYKKICNILFLGESTIAGVGVESHSEGFAGIMSQELAKIYKTNIQWKIVARSGYTVEKVNSKLLDQIGEFNPHIIIIGLGGNDAFKLHSPWKWNKENKRLIKKLHLIFNEVPIIYTNMPPIKEFPAFTKSIKFVVGNLIEILGHELEDVVKELPNVYYSSKIIRLKDWLHIIPSHQHSAKFFSDGIHPSKLTYQTWGKEMAKFIYETDIML